MPDEVESRKDLQTRFQFAPEALVHNGCFNLGIYRDPFKQINPLDARISVMPWSKGVKNLLLKEWEHYGLVNRRFFVSLALFNSKRLGLAQVVTYDRQTKNKVIHEMKMRPRTLDIPNELWDSHACVSTPGLSLSIRHELSQGLHHIEFQCERNKTRPGIQGLFTCYEDLEIIEPIVVCLPLGRRRAMYSHKAILPLEGRLRVGNETFVFSKEDSFALPDIHKGYYPYVMKWHWATGGGWNREGQLIGFNLTNNQVKDQKTYNENCLWINGKGHLLPPVQFFMKSNSLEHPWRIQDREGRVDVEFHPEATRNINMNLLILRSRYRGPYGSFSGHIVDSENNDVNIGHCFGVAEDFYLRA